MPEACNFITTRHLKPVTQNALLLSLKILKREPLKLFGVQHCVARKTRLNAGQVEGLEQTQAQQVNRLTTVLEHALSVS